MPKKGWGGGGTFDDPAIFAKELLQGLLGSFSVEATDKELSGAVCLCHAAKSAITCHKNHELLAGHCFMVKKLTTSIERGKVATLFSARVWVCRILEMAINVSAAVALARFAVNVQGGFYLRNCFTNTRVNPQNQQNDTVSHTSTLRTFEATPRFVLAFTTNGSFFDSPTTSVFFLFISGRA